MARRKQNIQTPEQESVDNRSELEKKVDSLREAEIEIASNAVREYERSVNKVEQEILALRNQLIYMRFNLETSQNELKRLHEMSRDEFLDGLNKSYR